MNKSLLAIAALSVLVSVAQAAPINGTASTAGASVTADLASIDLGATFTFGASAFTGGTGDLFNVAPVFSAVNTNPVKVALGEAAAFSASWGSFTGLITSVGSSIDGNNRTVSFYALGDFTPAFGAFTNGPMSMTFSATQTGGANAAISASYTIASPPASIPEPTSLGLVGLALAGLGCVRRRRAV